MYNNIVNRKIIKDNLMISEAEEDEDDFDLEGPDHFINEESSDDFTNGYDESESEDDDVVEDTVDNMSTEEDELDTDYMDENDEDDLGFSSEELDKIGLKDGDEAQTTYIKKQFKEMIDLYTSVLNGIKKEEVQEEDEQKIINDLCDSYSKIITRVYDYLEFKFGNSEMVDRVNTFLSFRTIFVALNEKRDKFEKLLDDRYGSNA